MEGVEHWIRQASTWARALLSTIQQRKERDGKSVRGDVRLVLEGKAEEVEAMARRLLAEGHDPVEIIDKGCVPGIEKAGELFSLEQLFLPQLMLAAEAMKAATRLLEPEILKAKGERKPLGRVVIGTVEGDIHDIGKSIVASLLSAAGFDVKDVGVDVSSERFLKEVKEFSPDLLGLSALLTNAMMNQRQVIDLLKEQGLREKVKVMVGGAPVTREWADHIGADGYAENAVDAVELAKGLMRGQV